MKNEKYWKKRQEEKLSSILNDAQVASEYVSDIYSKASLYTQSKINGIFEKYRDGHGLSNADAKEMLDSLISDRDYNQIKRILENNPKTKQRKELLKKLDTPPYQYRIKRLENMQSQLDKLMNEVYKVEKDVSTDCYINSAFNAYYRNVYNLQKGMKVAYQFDMLDTELIDSMLKSRWSGKNYSNRIWDNTNALAESLKDEMLMGVLTNKTEKEMADTIMNKFAVGAYQARRLIQTESAAMTAFADQQAFKDAGIEKEMFIAVHDSRTSQICQHHDRSIVEIAKAKVGVNVPPLHPNCRSHMIPYIEGVTDAMKKRQRNPVTNKDEVVDVSENYDQWLKRQQEEHGVDTVNSFMEKTKNASSDRKQYNKYIDVLGKENMPTSLSKFQDMKYNDVEKFNDLKLHFKDSKLQKGITESYNLTLREGQQGKHILGHNNYLEGRSYIVDASMKDIQECIKKHAGNGTINRYRNGDWDNTESIVDNSIVGYVLSIDKTWIATNKFKIHYSKEKGTHMVPTLKGVKKND
ncbi:polymorphic toxin type 50 domain-containing protein [Faecalibacillus intestinalis]|uniref:polymorphic toxin type 50 domain-containing protein n=1 Tax=Faecalibacillus intestinalis TaxID=1982626 RepID=UPI003994206D